MLRPLYTNKATKVLLVGSPSSGKRTLANQMMNCPEIFYTTHLLEEINDSLLDRVLDMDYVLLMVDMTNPASEALLNQTLTFMSPGHILSKCAIVFTKVDMTDIWMVNEMEVRNLIQRFGNPMVFYANLKDDYLRKKTCDQLTRAISIGTFQQRQVHPLGLLFMDTYFTRNNDGASRIDGDNDPNDVYDAPVDNDPNDVYDAPVDNDPNDVYDAPVDNDSNDVYDAPGDNDPNDVYDAPGDDKMDTKSDDLNEDSVHDNEARIDSNPPSLSS
ncbi:hypothetical protein [Absidia glauca]|uniref:Uncharacterized protein n=1 Tax=Absidia glauca TaxID=4829 RepID=A0A163KFM1_ABSGL|nr:hypothetical protein [Absidia glauca]